MRIVATSLVGSDCLCAVNVITLSLSEHTSLTVENDDLRLCV